MTQTATKIIVTDIDGRAWHTVDSGPADQVRARFAADHPVQRLIDAALVDGEATATYLLGREEYTTRVHVVTD